MICIGGTTGGRRTDHWIDSQTGPVLLVNLQTLVTWSTCSTENICVG